MKTKHGSIAIISMLFCVLLIGSMATTVCAAESASVFLQFKDDEGVVDGSKEFIIPANSGDNFDIEIVFTGSISTEMSLSFTYDLVTDDQMIANVYKSDDRSGLLNEPVVKGKEEKRNFSVAAIDGDIVITASGKGKVLSINAIKQKAKTAGTKTTVYTVGDSLVQTYSARYAPQTGWGQTLELYFNDNVNFVNRALGGRSTGNYIRQGRLNQVLCEIVPGDVVLIEFGHNDGDTSKADRYVNTTNFMDYLENVYIKAIRDRGAIPVLVTLCNRNQYIKATDEYRVSYPEYVNAMISAAKSADALLIDLNALTVECFGNLCRELGPDITDEIIYNHAIADAYDSDYKAGVKDDTHLQYYGAKLVAGLISEKLAEMKLAGVSEHYTPLVVESVPTTPSNITPKPHEKYVSRIKWHASDNADYYKILVSEVIEVASANPEEAPSYELTGEFTIAGYTTICDYAYPEAEEGKHYAYKVIAVNAAGESAESEIFSFDLLQEKEPDESQNTTTDNDNKKESDFNPVPIIITVIASIILVAIILFILIRKRNTK